VSVAPLLVVFHTPPCAAPTYQIDVFFSYTARSATRPDMIAGPIERKCRLSNCVATGIDCADCVAAACARSDCVAKTKVAAQNEARHT
jgi:hypothetical protein